jgi:hypothetical protein
LSNKKKLTEFEQEFIEQYFIQGSNATKAYQATSEKVKKKQVKYESAKANGCKYKKQLADEIEARRQELRLRDGKVVDTILYILQKTLFYNIDNILTVKNNQMIVKDSEDWTEVDKLLINNIEAGRQGLKVDLLDKKWAMTTLLKLYGLIAEENTDNLITTTGLENKTNDEIFELLKALEDEEDE